MSFMEGSSRKEKELPSHGVSMKAMGKGLLTKNWSPIFSRSWNNKKIKTRKTIF
jgi:hypothetical protein